MMMVVLLGIISLAVVALILNQREVINIDRTPSRTVTGSALLVPGVDGQPPDVLILTSESGSTDYTLAYLSHEERDIRWRSPSLGETDQLIKITRRDDVLYIATGTALIALNQENGDSLWQVDLSAEITAACQDCLQTSDEAIFALTADGILHSFAAESGELLWEYELNTIPDRLLLIGDQPAIIDDLEASTDKALYIFDPLTGLPDQVIQPACQSDEGIETLGPNAAVLVDGETVYFLFGSSIQGCAQRWEDGVMTWRRSIDLGRSSWPRSWYNTSPLLAGDMIYFTGAKSGVLLALNTNNGDLRTIISSTTHDLQPLAVDDGVLIAHAVQTEETDELWALDVETGERHWTYPFDLDSTSWTAHAVPSGLMVIQVLPGPDRLLVDILDQRSGERLHRDITPVNSTYWSGITWLSDTAWLTLRDLYTVDLHTGETTLFWPLP